MRGNFTRFLVGMIIFGAFFVLLPSISHAQFQIVPHPTGIGACKQKFGQDFIGGCVEGKCAGVSGTIQLPDGGTIPAARPVAPSGISDVECDYTFCDLVRIFTNIARIIFGTAGGLALLYFLWGAITLIVSGGSAEKVAAGKKSISAALWGLLIVLISYQLVGVLLATAADISGTKGGTAGGIQVESGGTIKIFTRPWSELQRCAPSLIQIPPTAPAGGSGASSGGGGAPAGARPGAPAPFGK